MIEEFTMIEQLLLLLIWIVCGFFSYGGTYAHFYTKYPCQHHKIYCWFQAFMGPFGLVATLLCGRHGFKWSGLEKERGE